jgi:hypothetical protein
MRERSYRYVRHCQFTSKQVKRGGSLVWLRKPCCYDSHPTSSITSIGHLSATTLALGHESPWSGVSFAYLVGFQEFHFHRLEIVGKLESEHLRVERQLRFH